MKSFFMFTLTFHVKSSEKACKKRGKTTEKSICKYNIIRKLAINGHTTSN